MSPLPHLTCYPLDWPTGAEHGEATQHGNTERIDRGRWAAISRSVEDRQNQDPGRVRGAHPVSPRRKSTTSNQCTQCLRTYSSGVKEMPYSYGSSIILGAGGAELVVVK